jgi:energy-coupling factor transporter ATP-binding protein EcfA2
MAEQIKSIHLKRFKKFKDNVLQATQHNILVGANNSGKTSILHALRLFFLSLSGEFSGPVNNISFHKRYISVGEILPVADSVELWTDCKKGNTKTTGIIIELEFNEGLKVDAVFTHRFGQIHVDASIAANPQGLDGQQINEAMAHRVAFIPGLVGILPQEPYVTPARRSAMSIEARYSEMYRSSLLHLSETDSNALKSINEVLKQHLNVEVTSIEFDPEKDVYVDIEYTQDNIALDLANAGSGMLQIVQLLVYIYLHKPTLLLIDEPDAHLHPELQEKLGPILKTVTDNMKAQLFVATHSPDVIDAFDPGEVLFMNAEKKKLAALKKDNAYVDGLIEAGIITNSALSRIAVRPKCLVVEDSKITIFKAIDRLMGTKLFDFAGDFKQAKGVSKFQTIQEVYLTVQEVVGKKIAMFFIQDRDGLPDRFVGYIQNKYQQKGLDVHILARHELENYLLDGKIIRAALLAKGKDISLKDCRGLLVQAAETIKATTRGEIRRKCKQVNHFCKKPDNMDDNAVEAEVDQWFDALTLNEATVLKVFPGKDLLKALCNLVSEQHSVEIRESDLRAALTRDRLPDEVKNIFTQIAEAKKA